MDRMARGKGGKCEKIFAITMMMGEKQHWRENVHREMGQDIWTGRDQGGNYQHRDFVSTMAMGSKFVGKGEEEGLFSFRLRGTLSREVSDAMLPHRDSKCD